MWRYVSGNRRLLAEDLSQAQIDHITHIFQPNVALCGLAIALALILPQVAAAVFLIVAVVGFVCTG